MSNIPSFFPHPGTSIPRAFSDFLSVCESRLTSERPRERGPEPASEQPLPPAEPLNPAEALNAPLNPAEPFNQAPAVSRTQSVSRLEAALHPPGPGEESGDGERAAAGPARLRRILVPTDFSEPSCKALEYAVALCRALGEDGPEVLLLHAVEPLPYPDEFGLGMRLNALPLEPWRERLEGLAEGHVPAALRGPVRVTLGIPHQVICEAAQKWDADLVVIATHGYTGLRRFFLGSTTEKVVRHAPCPVLVVRDREHDFVAAPPEPSEPSGP